MVVVVHVERKMVGKSLPFLSGAPGLSEKPIHIGSEHRGRVVKAEQRIPAPFLEFPLSGDRRSATYSGCVNCVGKTLSECSRVSWILVRLE